MGEGDRWVKEEIGDQRGERCGECERYGETEIGGYRRRYVIRGERGVESVREMGRWGDGDRCI